jgi:hypothetical protein
MWRHGLFSQEEDARVDAGGSRDCTPCEKDDGREESAVFSAESRLKALMRSRLEDFIAEKEAHFGGIWGHKAGEFSAGQFGLVPAEFGADVVFDAGDNAVRFEDESGARLPIFARWRATFAHSYLLSLANRLQPRFPGARFEPDRQYEKEGKGVGFGNRGGRSGAGRGRDRVRVSGRICVGNFDVLVLINPAGETRMT